MLLSVPLCLLSSLHIASCLNRHHSPAVAVTLLLSPSIPLTRFCPLFSPHYHHRSQLPPLSRHRLLMSPAPIFCCYFPVLTSQPSSYTMSPSHASCHPFLKSLSCSPYVILTAMPPSLPCHFCSSGCHCPCLMLLVFPMRSHPALQGFSFHVSVICSCHPSHTCHHSGWSSSPGVCQNPSAPLNLWATLTT